MKMSRIPTLALGLAILPSLPALAAPPEVSNIRPSQRAGTKLIDVYYDLADAEGDTCTVAITIFDNTSPLPVYAITGDVGQGVTPGTDRHIVWNAGQDWNRRFTTQGKARIVADDAPTTPPNASMAFVPAGFSNPGVEIYTSGFFMEKLEVSKELWDGVYAWAVSNGYNFSETGVGTSPIYPISYLSWYDAVKWCNARSEMEGLVPCYYTDPAKSQVYRAGEVVVSNDWVSWDTDGYRLPTRAEWLKAYWGGNYAGFYPWPSYGGNYNDHILPSYGAYTSSATEPVGTYDGSQPGGGPDMANGYGLYDMFGNVGEWCWDRYFTDWYNRPEAQDDNSRGPNDGVGTQRCFSGLRTSFPWDARSQPYVLADKVYRYPSPTHNGTVVGLRCVRSR